LYAGGQVFGNPNGWLHVCSAFRTLDRVLFVKFVMKQLNMGLADPGTGHANKSQARSMPETNHQPLETIK
jgi:hypothetical protein